MRLLSFLLVLLSTLPLLSQGHQITVVDGLITFERIDSFRGVGSEDLQKRAVAWLSSQFTSHRDELFLNAKDRISGVYHERYYWSKGGTNTNCRQRVVIDVKDEAAKFLITDIQTVSYTGLLTIGQRPIEEFIFTGGGRLKRQMRYLLNDIDEKLTKVYQSYLTYMGNPNW